LRGPYPFEYVGYLMKRLEKIIANAYQLALQVQDDNRDERVMQALAEEVAGESAEFLALLNNDLGSFGHAEVMDPELLALVNSLTEVQS